MQIDPVLEWRRLTQHYREMGDSEIVELAAQFADLTDTAQQVLRDELRRRGLLQPGAPNGTEKKDGTEKNAHHLGFPGWGSADSLQDASVTNLPSASGHDAHSEEDSNRLHEYTWKMPLDECNTREEAWQICEMLRRAGIESWIEDRSSEYAMDSANPRVLVAADQLDQARAIAANPIPQEIVEESKMMLPDFVPPTCPACGAADPMLESIEPVNRWLCELCGRRWDDPAPQPAHQSASQSPKVLF